MTGHNRSQRQPANHNQRNQPQLHRPAMNEHLALAHREPDQQRQNCIQPESYWKAALQIRVCQLRMRALQSLAFIRLRVLAHSSPSQQWCTGEDSNLRSSKERQIYSLLPLTARPPVHSHPSDKTLPQGTSNQLIPPIRQPTRYASSAPFQRIGSRPEYLRHFGVCTSNGITAEDRPGASKKSARRPMQPFSGPVSFSSFKWSWRRDLNPRPSDYKSDALPAELRQPFPPRKYPEN
jgi:hypothetical protein